jgi:membrane protein
MINVPTYSVIYGSLSLIPIFILWTFICWHITLVGAVMLKGLQLVKINLKFSETAKRDYLTIAVSIIKDLHNSQKDLSNGSTMSAVYSNVGAHNFDMVKEIIYKLESSNIIRVTTDNMCYLNCDVNSLKLRDIYNCFDSIINSKTSSSKKINALKTNLYNDLNISVYECF